MIDSLYKFASEAEAIALLPEYRATSEEGSHWITASSSHCLDPAGHLYEITPTEDPENPTVTPLDGWHLNLRTWGGREIPAQANLVTPVNPKRVWA